MLRFCTISKGAESPAQRDVSASDLCTTHAAKMHVTEHHRASYVGWSLHFTIWNYVYLSSFSDHGTLWMHDAENKCTMHQSKLGGMRVIRPKHITKLQLVWILLCKLVKINNRSGTLNQEVFQIAQWCRTVCFLSFSVCWIHSTLRRAPRCVCACERVLARLWKHLHILLSLIASLSLFFSQSRKRKELKKEQKSLGSFNTAH